MAVEVRAVPNLKSVVSLIGTIGAIAYCAYLLYYFVDVTGSVQEAQVNGLGPTLMGLAIVGLIFCIVLVVKIARMFARPRSTGSGPDRWADDGESGFDAEAAVARYMARRSTEAAAAAATVAPAAQERGALARGASFGRKNKRS